MDDETYEKLMHMLAGDINLFWSYDWKRPDKKCAIFHKNHLHLQVHPNTIYNKEVTQ
jgi:hypothetical protein